MDLYSHLPDEEEEIVFAQPNVPGLKLIEDYLSGDEEQRLLAHIEAGAWLTELKRRVQHYGYKYDYTARKIDASMRVGQLPDWAESLAQRLVADGHMTEPPDQLIVNEYEPGQGISAHVDCVPCFGPVIGSVSLGSPCLMKLLPEEGKAEDVFLPRRSLLVLAGEARYRWRHAIPARRKDVVAGRTVPRGRRVSLTFRKVPVETPPV